MTDAAPAIPPARPPATPEDLFRRLDELGIKTVTHSHPPLMTVEDSKRLRGELPGGHCKNLFLKDRKGLMWLVVTHEDRRVDIKSLEKKLGAARLSFASPERLMAALGIQPGAVTPFALINDKEQRVTVVLDQAMLGFALLNYHPLTNDRTTAIAAGDLVRFIEACGHRPQILNLEP